MNLRYLFLILIFFFSLNGYSQEQSRFTQYMFNKYSFNPAFAGLDGSLSLYVHYRNQWTDLEFSPNTIMFNTHIPVYALNGAIGLKVKRDEIGLFKDNSFSVSYNFVKDSNIGLFSLGMGLGYRKHDINGSLIITPEGQYGSNIDHKDPILSNETFSSSGVIWDFGIVYLFNKIETGVSFSNLILNNLNYNLFNSYSNPDLKVFFQYNYSYSKSLNIKPSALLVTDFKATRIDISSVFDYYGKIFAGFSLQIDNKIKIAALGITTGTKINQNIRINYSYDIGLSQLKTLHEGTHELVLNYNLNKFIGSLKKLPVIYSPRNL